MASLHGSKIVTTPLSDGTRALRRDQLHSGAVIWIPLLLLFACNRETSYDTVNAGNEGQFRAAVLTSSSNTALVGGQDPTSPVAISDVVVVPAVDSAQISWKTAGPSSTSTLSYGTDTSFGTSVITRDSGTTHAVSVSPLNPGTKYFFSILSRGGPGELDSTPIQYFTTLPVAQPSGTPSGTPTSPPISTVSPVPLPSTVPGNLPTPSRALTLALRLFDRLAGVPLDLRDSRLQTMINAINAGDYMGAANVAVSDPGFYNITLKHFAAPMSSKGEDPSVPLNDFIATLIGTARDDLDARQLLTGNFVYKGSPKVMTGTVMSVDTVSGVHTFDLQDDYPLLASNHHYSQMEQLRVDLYENLVSVPQRGYATPPVSATGRELPTKVQPIVLPDTAGLLTTRQWAQEHFFAGTNRRATQFAISTFLCQPNTNTKDFSALDTRVRRDVSRAPGGNPTIYKTSCQGCHAAGDAMSGAWAYFDSGPQGAYLLYTAGQVQQKYAQNISIAPTGYWTTDDSWINLYTQNQNAALGWSKDVPTQGKGVASLGNMIANSSGFASCMATRAFTEVCKRAPDPVADAGTISTITDVFVKSGYKLRKLFQAAATASACLGN